MEEQQPFKIMYARPAKHYFNSFQDQATYYLDTFCANWKNYENPSNHIIPPLFSYKRADVSDEIIQVLEEQAAANQKQNYVLSDRLGDTGEHIMFKLLDMHARHKFFAPFVVIRGLTIDERRKKLLKHIFPTIIWPNLECDFIVVGPKIGIIIVEVKSGLFKNKKGFSDDNHLPNDYNKGIEQLNKTESLLNRLQQHLGLPPIKNVCKIIFTPNLERSKYMDWHANLPEKEKDALGKKTKTIHQIFREHVDTIMCLQQLPIYEMYENLCGNIIFAELVLGIHVEEMRQDEDKWVSSMNEMLQRVRHFPSKTSQQEYELCAKILVGLSSIMELPSSKDSNYASPFPHYPSLVVTIDEALYCKQLAINMEALRLKRHMPSNDKKEKAKAKAKNSILLPVSKSEQVQSYLQNPLSVVFLTPEQIGILKGSTRQIIFGHAGTGKTILLQAKALELLKKDHPVTVIACGKFILQYKKLFDENGCANYRIRDWRTLNEHCNEQKAKPTAKEESSDQLTNQLMSSNSDLTEIKRCLDTITSEVLLEEQIELFGKALQAPLDSLPQNHPLIVKVQTFIKIQGLRHLYTRLQGLVSQDHIICDDLPLGSEADTFENFLALLALIKISEPNRIAWLAVHPAGYIPFYTDYQILGGACGFTTTGLNRVMRCSEAVFDATYPPKDLQPGLVWKSGQPLFPTSKLWQKFEPTLGHKIQGIKPTCSRRHFPTADTAWKELLIDLPELVTKLLHQNTYAASDFIAVLFTAGSLNAPNTAKNIGHVMAFVALKIPDMDSHAYSMHMKNYIEAYNLPFLSKDTCIPVKRLVTTIDWTELHPSFEWPVVIHAIIGSVLDLEENKSYYEYCLYQARSRAITTFAELFYTYDKETNFSFDKDTISNTYESDHECDTIAPAIPNAANQNTTTQEKAISTKRKSYKATLYPKDKRVTLQAMTRLLKSPSATQTPIDATDEVFHFGQMVVCRLRALPIEARREAQKKIMSLLDDVGDRVQLKINQSLSDSEEETPVESD